MGKVFDRVRGRTKKEEEAVKELQPASSAAPSSALTQTVPDKIYLKSLSIRSLEDLNKVKDEIRSGNIVILRVGQLAEKNMNDVSRAVSELSEFVKQISGDIARLGEERVVLTPSFIKIWREKAAEAEG